MEAVGIGIAVAVFLLIIVLALAIRVVPEYRRMVVFRLGRVTGLRGPGLVLLIPLVDRPTNVDLREFFLEIPHQTSITKDNAPISIDFIIFYKVVDGVSSVVQVGNFAGAAQNIAATTLRSVVGDISLDDVLAKRDEINEILRTKLDEITERWGVKVTNVEIREIIPPPAVQEAMTRQMSGERTRRALVTEAEGDRQAAITRAEGDKQANILTAEGNKQAAILNAEATGGRPSSKPRASPWPSPTSTKPSMSAAGSCPPSSCCRQAPSRCSQDGGRSAGARSRSRCSHWPEQRHQPTASRRTPSCSGSSGSSGRASPSPAASANRRERSPSPNDRLEQRRPTPGLLCSLHGDRGAKRRCACSRTRARSQSERSPLGSAINCQI